MISAMSSHFCTRQAATGAVPFRATPHVILIPSAFGGLSLQYSKCFAGQRRSFFFWRRCRGLDSQARFDRRFQRARDRAECIFYKRARRLGRNDDWYSRYYSLHGHRPSRRWRMWRDLEEERSVSNDELQWSKWKDPWYSQHDAERERMEQEFEKLKREIESDPYGMVFGRRLEPFAFSQHRHPWSDFFHNMLGFDNTHPPAGKRGPSSVQSTKKVKWQDSQSEKNHSPSGPYDASFEFDPVSGRMVQTKSSNEAGEAGSHSMRQGLDFVEKSDKSPKEPRPVIDIEQSKSPKSSEKMMGDKGQTQTQNVPVAAKSGPAKGAEKTDMKENNESAVFLMGEPHQKEVDSSSSSGTDGAASSVNAKREGTDTKNESSSKPQPFKDEKSSDTISRSRSPQALFSEFKDYITSKLQTDSAGESPDTSNWPFSFRPAPVSRARSRDDRPSQASYHKDPEAEDLQGLRVSDVRSSFKHRVHDPTLLESKKAGDTTDEVPSPGIVDPQHRSDLDQRGQSSRQKTASNEPSVAASSTKNVNSMLRDAIRQTYEDTHGEVDPNSQGNVVESEGVGRDQVKGEKEKSAAPATESPAASATRVSSGGNGEAPCNAELDKLLVDIEHANTAASALLSQIREGMQKNTDTQEPGETQSKAVPTSSSTEYIVLAYDALAREVKEASMMSGSSVPFEPLHPADAVTRLYNPSRFLPYFPALEAQGYELFSGGPEVLVFKKTKGPVPDPVASGTEDAVHSPAQTAQRGRESIDTVESDKGVSQPPSSTEPFSHSSRKDARDVHSAAQTAQLEKDSIDAVESSKTEPQTSSSSYSSKQDTNPILGNTVRRMLLGGVAAGGSCYAVGVVVEYFRTGGTDGLGPRGFTGLEGR